MLEPFLLKLSRNIYTDFLSNFLSHFFLMIQTPCMPRILIKFCPRITPYLKLLRLNLAA